MTAIRIILGIAIGLGVDWALFGRLKMLLWPIGYRSEVEYRDLPPARLLFVIVASGVVGFSLKSGGPLPFPFWVGMTMMLLATVYAVFFAFRR